MGSRDTLQQLETIAPATFRDDFLQANRPVVLRNFAMGWPALRKWSPRYFAERFGDVQVEVAADVKDPSRSGTGCYAMRRSMSMRAFATAIEEAEPPDLYLVAQNQALGRPEFDALWSDLQLDSGYFETVTARTSVRLWMGPRDTLTPLHHDLQDALLLQVYGSKRILLIAPEDTRYLYTDGGGYSPVDPERPDPDRHPLFSAAKTRAVVIAPGDALFLPHGWWHHVRALSPSISLSMGRLAGGKDLASRSTA